MAVKVFQPSQYKEEAKQLLRDGKTPEEVHTILPLSVRTLYRYFSEVQEEKKNTVGGRVIEERPGPAKVVTQTTPAQFAVVTTKTPGSIVFVMGDQKIDLNPQDLYDAWRYCQDIKRIVPAIDDDFTLMIKVAAKHLWEFFSQREARRVGVDLEVIKEG